MGTAKIIYPTITVADQHYFGRIYFLCPRDCIFNEICEPKNFYEKIEVDRPGNIHELIQDKMKKEVMDEFERHKEARTGSRIRCPSGDYTFEITRDFTKTNGSALGEPFNEYHKILMRECVKVEPTS